MFKKIVLFSFIVVGMMMAVPVLAVQPPIPNEDLLGLQYGEQTGLGTDDLRGTAVAILNVALGLLGVIFVGLVVYGGFRWMTAAGNEEGVNVAKKTLYSGVIGLIIILSAFTISNFVLRNVYKATTGYDYSGGGLMIDVRNN